MTEKYCAVRPYRGRLTIKKPLSDLYFEDRCGNYSIKATEDEIIDSCFGKNRTIRIYDENNAAHAVFVRCIKGEKRFNFLLNVQQVVKYYKLCKKSQRINGTVT